MVLLQNFQELGAHGFVKAAIEGGQIFRPGLPETWRIAFNKIPPLQRGPVVVRPLVAYQGNDVPGGFRWLDPVSGGVLIDCAGELSHPALPQAYDGRYTARQHQRQNGNQRDKQPMLRHRFLPCHWAGLQLRRLGQPYLIHPGKILKQLHGCHTSPSFSKNRPRAFLLLRREDFTLFSVSPVFWLISRWVLAK